MLLLTFLLFFFNLAALHKRWAGGDAFLTVVVAVERFPVVDLDGRQLMILVVEFFV
jgi:hypothetical protein